MKIVGVGGGSATKHMMRALLQSVQDKPHIELSSLHSTFDNGGNSAQIRERGWGAIGDIRGGIEALADPSLLTWGIGRIFCHRFKKIGQTKEEACYLDGASGGNLLLAASLDIQGGDWRNLPAVIKQWSVALGVKGKVLPISLDIAKISGLPLYPGGTSGGAPIFGEMSVEKAEASLCPIVSISLIPHAEIYEGAAQALREADIIVFWPGSLWGSVIVNTRVKGFREAYRVAQKRGARTAVVTNLTSPLENTHFRTTEAYIRELEGNIILDEGEQFDAAFCNIANESLDSKVIRSLKKSGQVLLEFKPSPHVKTHKTGKFCVVNEKGNLVHNDAFFKSFLNWIQKE